MKFFIAIMAMLMLSACGMTPSSSPLGDAGQGYQFSDGTEALSDQQREYCSTTSPLLRAALLTAIRVQVPGYPPSGLCTDAEQKLAEEVARQAEKVEGTVDLEQAREDQRRFQEMADEDRDPASSVDDPSAD